MWLFPSHPVLLNYEVEFEFVLLGFSFHSTNCILFFFSSFFPPCDIRSAPSCRIPLGTSYSRHRRNKSQNTSRRLNRVRTCPLTCTRVRSPIHHRGCPMDLRLPACPAVPCPQPRYMIHNYIFNTVSKLFSPSPSFLGGALFALCIKEK